MTEFGFIGCGNMGGTLCTAVAKVCNNIKLYDKDKEKSVQKQRTNELE